MFIYSRILNEEGKKGRGQRERVRRQRVLDQALQDSWFTTQFLIYLSTLFLYRIHSAIISTDQQSWNPLLEGRRGGKKRRKKTLKKKKKNNYTNNGVRRNSFSIKKKTFSLSIIYVCTDTHIYVYVCVYTYIYIYTHTHTQIIMYINLYIFFPSPWRGEGALLFHDVRVQAAALSGRPGVPTWRHSGHNI